MKSETILPVLLTIAGACAYSGFTRSRLYHHLKNKDIEARKAGRRTLIERASLDRLLAALPKAA